MKLLVAGANRVDAGKTTVATGLVVHVDGIGFKPRAGNDYWFDHDDCREVLQSGRLYGTDSRRIATASRGQFEPEAINAVHRLWRPSPGPDTGLLGRADREFLLDRAGDRFVVNGTVDLPALVRESLDLEGAIVVDSLGALNDATEAVHLPAQADLLADVRSADRAVVESYGDVATPLSDYEPDAVVVVEPHRLRVYDGARYDKARDVAPRGRRDGTLEQRVDAVVDLLDPVETARLEPLPASTRNDPAAVASAYDGAFDRVRAVARQAASPA